MKCIRCDSPVGDTARFCEHCGVLLRGNDFEQRLSEAYRLELGSRFDDAVAAYEALLRHGMSEADSARVRKHLGNLHFRLGHLRRAREHLVRACELDPENGTLWHDRGVVAYHLARFEEAERALREALRLDSGLLLAYFWLAQALYHRGEYGEAERGFRSLLERSPNFTIARFHLAVILARGGRREAAEEQFRRVLLENPKDAAARYYIAPP